MLPRRARSLARASSFAGISGSLSTGSAEYAPGVMHERVEIAVGGATLLGDRWIGAGRAIALLHAGVCDRRSWRDVGAQLSAAGWDVVAYDRRGFGEVPPSGGRFRHVDDLLAVLDAVSPDAPAWLVGSSMGGEVALDAALEVPERVAGLVLLAPAVSGDREPDEEAYNAATNGLADGIDAAWTASDLEGCNRLEVRLWLDGPAGPEGRVSGPPRELALDMNRIVIANGESDADGASGLDAASRVHEIALPAIVACGELDVSMKVRRSAELADALLNATYRRLPGRAHLPYLEAPDEVAALITAEAA
jgi:pimeloyl-ACP methyl ester carboxylesterase